LESGLANLKGCLMSLSEIIVVIIVAIVLMKPDDIPVILKRIQGLKTYITNMKKEVLSYITEDIETTEKQSIEYDEEIRFYLQKIININGLYEGDYTIESLKAKYYELIEFRAQEEFKLQKLQKDNR